MEGVFCCFAERCGGTTSAPNQPLQTEEDDLPILEEVRDAVKHLMHN
jgi:hypothetical protein